MNSIAFSAATLDDDQAFEIAKAYVKGDRDPPRIAKLLGVDRFDLNLVMHPLVRGHIVRLQREASKNYSLEEHILQLKKIRDAAFDDDNFKVALASETQLGKVAGHYEPKLPDQDPSLPVDATKLSTDELRRRVAAMVGGVIPQPETPALPGSLEGQKDDDLDDSF